MAPAAAILEPEEAAAYFTANPNLARSHPDVARQVSDAVKAKAAAHQAAAPVVRSQPKPAASGGPSTLASLASTSRQLDAITPGRLPGRSGVLPRLIIATFAGIAVLELVSQMTKQYFTYDLKKAPANAASAAKFVGLYGGQAADLAAIRSASPPAARTASTANAHGMPAGSTL